MVFIKVSKSSYFEFLEGSITYGLQVGVDKAIDRLQYQKVMDQMIFATYLILGAISINADLVLDLLGNQDRWDPCFSSETDFGTV